MAKAKRLAELAWERSETLQQQNHKTLEDSEKHEVDEAVLEKQNDQYVLETKNISEKPVLQTKQQAEEDRESHGTTNTLDPKVDNTQAKDVSPAVSPGRDESTSTTSLIVEKSESAIASTMNLKAYM